MTTLPSPWLRSTDWLAEHLDYPDLVILDGSYFLPTQKRDADAEFLEAHIPGAQRFDIDVVKDPDSDLPHMMPPATVFSAACRKLGIGDGKSILIYDALGLFSAPRVWWMFRSYGAERVFILDGGLPKWIAEGRPVESGPARNREPRHFTPRRNHGAVADLGDVKKALAGGKVQVVDARPADRFRGEAPEPRAGLRGGHMPGALNVPSSALVENGRSSRRTASATPSPRPASISTARSSPAAAPASRPASSGSASTPSASSRPASMTGPGANGAAARIARWSPGRPDLQTPCTNKKGAARRPFRIRRGQGPQCRIWLRKSLVRSCCGFEKKAFGSFISMICP